MRISTRIKLIENQIKALKNKKRILIESIKPMAPEPPRANPEQKAAAAISKWANLSTDNMAAVQLYLLLAGNHYPYIPEMTKRSYEAEADGEIYNAIYDMITSLSPDAYQDGLHDSYDEEDAVEDAISVAFYRFKKMEDIGGKYCRYDVSPEYQDPFEYADVKETFWEKVASRLRNTIEI